MRAFLKRRWILLSCAGALLTASVFDVFRSDQMHQPSALGSISHECYDRDLLKSGNVVYDSTGKLVMKVEINFNSHGEENPDRDLSVTNSVVWKIDSHLPKLGGLPSLHHEPGYTRISLPLWLPLSAILGWIVVRELRWREKRAKEATQSS